MRQITKKKTHITQWKPFLINFYPKKEEFLGFFYQKYNYGNNDEIISCYTRNTGIFESLSKKPTTFKMDALKDLTQVIKILRACSKKDNILMSGSKNWCHILSIFLVLK